MLGRKGVQGDAPGADDSSSSKRFARILTPFYPFRLVGRGLRGLVRRGKRATRRRNHHQSGGGPVASLSGAFLDAGGLLSDDPAAGNQDGGSWPPSYSLSLGKPSSPAFPLLLRTPPGDSWHQPQRLLAVGTRKWGGNLLGGAGSLLNVRVYDYALYVNPNQVHDNMARCLTEGAACPLPAPADPGRQLNAASLDMALSLRAARNLPISTLQKEYRAILQRRLQAAGGNPEDPSLHRLIHLIGPDHIPAASRTGASVRKGAMLTFVRRPDDTLVTVADGTVLGSVRSPRLCRALFDLYLGNQPVCEHSKAAAIEAAVRLAQNPQQPGYRPTGAKERLFCRDHSLDTCVVQIT